MELKLFFINILVFILFSIMITALSVLIPDSFLEYNKWLFKEREWEKSGSVYQRVFRVKGWKTLLPELSDFVGSIFPKKTNHGFERGVSVQIHNRILPK